MARTAEYRIAGRTAAEIAASAEELIASQRLVEGARLPTVRALAARLEVSPATVASAYRRLAARGLVTGRGRAGTTVARQRSRAARRSAPAVPPGTLDLATGGPDPALLPDLRPALATLAQDLGPGSGRSRPYGESGVLPGLGETLAGWIRAEGGPPDETGDGRGVLVVGGVLDGIERSLLAHVHPGDAVVGGGVRPQ
jgi:DNA-binding transcriptional MocR family regulator